MTNISIPKLTDYFNDTTTTIDFARMFISPWIYFFGSMFWGILFGAIGAGLYMKSQNIYVTLGYFIVVVSLGYQLFPQELLTIIAIICGLAMGFLLFQLFISKYGQ